MISSILAHDTTTTLSLHEQNLERSDGQKTNCNKYFSIRLAIEKSRALFCILLWFGHYQSTHIIHDHFAGTGAILPLCTAHTHTHTHTYCEFEINFKGIYQSKLIFDDDHMTKQPWRIRMNEFHLRTLTPDLTTNRFEQTQQNRVHI